MRKNLQMVLTKEKQSLWDFIAIPLLWVLEKFSSRCFRKGLEYGENFRKHSSLVFSKKNIKEYLQNKEFWKNFEKTEIWVFSKFYPPRLVIAKTCFSKILIQEYRNDANVRFFEIKWTPSDETCCIGWYATIRITIYTRVS